MNFKKEILELGIKAKKASNLLSITSGKQKNAALKELIKNLNIG